MDERQEFNTNCFGSLIACGVHSPPAISVFMFLAIVSDVPIEAPDKLESFTAFSFLHTKRGSIVGDNVSECLFVYGEKRMVTIQNMSD